MKYKIYFVTLVLFLLSTSAYCCGPWWYYPHEYYIYRSYDSSSSPNEDKIIANCEAWQDITDKSIPIEDIREVVYDYSYQQTQKLLRLKNWFSSNAFVKWIARHRDRDVRDFLELAKLCESTRAYQNSVWYYPCEDDQQMGHLEYLIGEFDRRSDNSRLSDRYALQKARALFNRRDYETIASWWEQIGDGIKPGIVKDMTVGYVAGAYYRLGQIDKAIKYYSSIGDLESIVYCLGDTGRTHDSFSYLELLAKYCPDSRAAESTLQDIFRTVENNCSPWDFSGMSYDKRIEFRRIEEDKADRYYAICMDAIGSGKCENLALWYYTAAFIRDLEGKPYEAREILAKAEQSKGSESVMESIRVMRMYLDARTADIESEEFRTKYKEQLFEDLQWLYGKIQGGITEDVIDRTETGYYLNISLSYYYWNDMLRKILIGEVAPRYIAIGENVFAMRLINMADNVLLGLVDTHSTYWHHGRVYEKSREMTMKEYREDTFEENMFDFSNYIFEQLDTADVKAVVAYAKAVLSDDRTKTAFDIFLDSNSYINADYLYEIIGTRYLRDMNYGEAVKYLSLVNPSYHSTTNICSYYGRNPFVYNNTDKDNRVKEKDLKQYKLWFAQKMMDYERYVNSEMPTPKQTGYRSEYAKEQTRKGEAMVAYGIGLKNSFDLCWPLTQYHLNYADDWIRSEDRDEIMAKAEKMIDRGLEYITDPETAAKNYVMLCRWKTAVSKYPGTDVAKKVKTKCDNLKDYKFKVFKQYERESFYY